MTLGFTASPTTKFPNKKACPTRAGFFSSHSHSFFSSLTAFMRSSSAIAATKSSLLTSKGSQDSRSVVMACATAITPAFGGRTSSVAVQRQGAAPRHLPQGEGYAPHYSAALLYQNVTARRSLLHFSCGAAALHTPKACFMRRSRASYAEGVLHAPQARFI